MPQKWFNSDGKEIPPNEILKYRNTKAQIDGNIIRAEINKPDGNTIYTEFDIEKNEMKNIVSKGFPQEYTLDIPENLIVNKQHHMTVIQGVTYRAEKCVLKFNGYSLVNYDVANNKIQGIDIKAPTGMKVFVDTTNKIVCIVDENKLK